MPSRPVAARFVDHFSAEAYARTDQARFCIKDEYNLKIANRSCGAMMMSIRYMILTFLIGFSVSAFTGCATADEAEFEDSTIPWARNGDKPRSSLLNVTGIDPISGRQTTVIEHER